MTWPIKYLAPAMTKFLEARHLTRRFGARTAVEDLCLELDRGEVLGILGPNGAGKSTSLRLLTGALTPDSGSVRIAGADLATEPLRAKAALGWLPERPPLYRDMRVDEYLAHCGRLRRVPRRGLPAAVTRAKARCGLEGWGRRLVGTLSRGYRQRLGIAQAILHEPALVVLDEPTAGLDPLQAREVRDLIRDLSRDRGLILSTHLLPDVQAVCGRVLILQDGRTLHEARLDDPAADRLRLVLAHPPEDAELRALPGVREIERLAPDAFRLRLEPPADAQDIARRAVEAGWGLRELTPEQTGLEQMLLDLMAREGAP